jgi:hypothetical protein
MKNIKISHPTVFSHHLGAAITDDTDTHTRIIQGCNLFVLYSSLTKDQLNLIISALEKSHSTVPLP